MTKTNKIHRFNFKNETIIAGKYKIEDKVGSGWEGEVYKASEITTKIPCALKFFYPKRNKKNKVAKVYAQKLHKLLESPVSIKYFTQEFIEFKGQTVTCLVFEYVEGEMLSTYIKRQRGKRLDILQGLQLLHSLASGIENLHRYNEYHGDLHIDNIIIKRRGLGFDFKLLDMYNWGDSKKSNMAEDICNLIRIFYDAIGGSKHYAKHPAEVKAICLGLKRTLILQKFKTATSLRQHIENIEWESVDRI